METTTVTRFEKTIEQTMYDREALRAYRPDGAVLRWSADVGDYVDTGWAWFVLHLDGAYVRAAECA